MQKVRPPLVIIFISSTKVTQINVTIFISSAKRVPTLIEISPPLLPYLLYPNAASKLHETD